MLLANEHRRDLDGHLVGSGSPFGIQDLPIDRAMSFIWWYVTKDAEPEERRKFEARLWRPPTLDTPIPAKSPWSAENEMKGFAALKAETGK